MLSLFIGCMKFIFPTQTHICEEGYGRIPLCYSQVTISMLIWSCSQYALVEHRCDSLQVCFTFNWGYVRFLQSLCSCFALNFPSIRHSKLWSCNGQFKCNFSSLVFWLVIYGLITKGKIIEQKTSMMLLIDLNYYKCMMCCVFSQIGLVVLRVLRVGLLWVYLDPWIQR